MPGLKLALLGAGNVAESYVRQVRRLREDGMDVELAAICGRMAEGANRLASRFGIAAHGADYDALLSRADIDGVIVLTPMQLHHAHAKSALLAGKHVLVEKTLAGTVDEAEELLALAEARGLCLAAAPFTTLSPTFQAARRRIAAGEIGEIRSARALYGWAGPDWAGWFHQQGAGPLRDLGIYGLTTLTGLLGPVRSVHALANGGNGTAPDNFQLSLEFANGCLGTVATGYTLQKFKTPGIEIYGTRGTLQFIGQDWAPEGHELWTNESGCWRSFAAPFAWPWTDGVRDFCQSILSRQPLASHPTHAVHVLDIVNQAMASAQSRRSEAVRTGFVRPTVEPEALAAGDHRRHNPLNIT